MPKRGSEADNRIFFDELVSVSVSRLRATGVIRLEDQWARIPFDEQAKLIGVAHTKFPNGGSWSYFVCPQVGEGPKGFGLSTMRHAAGCCLEKLGVRNRAAYGFGRTERLRERDRRIDRLQAMLEGGPMRFKPVPPNWGNRRLDRRNRLTWALQQVRIATRLAQIAYQAQHNSEPDEPSPLLRAYKPLAAAIEAIPNLKSLWRAKSTEDIQIALDNAQSALLEALESDDPRMRMIAARLMLKTRQARDRGWS